MNIFAQLLKNENNMTVTENGAAAYRSTGSECLDLFAVIGALRSVPDSDIINRFTKAFAEDPDMAVRILFYARDVRGGLGERRVFRVILRSMANAHPASIEKNIENIAEYGRYDDLITLLGTPCENAAVEYISKTFREDIEALENGESVSLLGKWLPSVNASSKETVRTAARLAKLLGMSSAEYRKVLTKLRAVVRIIENDLRVYDYSFDYSKQPSRAMFKYRKAFIRNDGERYGEFINMVNTGKAVMHTGNVMPYELVNSAAAKRHMSPAELAALDTTWKNLPDYGGNENILAVIDTSGSMYSGSPTPASVAISLGLYLAERNRGAFSNCFIEFSDKPTLIEIKGQNIVERIRYVLSFSRVANTNLEAVFELILNTAVKNHVPQSQLPDKLVLVSDMEFDGIVKNASQTVFENARMKFAKKGYKLPEVVFWNLQSRNEQQPVKMKENGAVLVSGMTPKIFEMVAGGRTSPYEFMMKVLGSERYSGITA